MIALTRQKGCLFITWMLHNFQHRMNDDLKFGWNYFYSSWFGGKKDKKDMIPLWLVEMFFLFVF